MSNEEDLIRAKLQLQNALGAQFEDYMASMRKWFAGKTTKQEFDKEAREIVTDNYVHFHNEFLLCIINKCNSFSSTATDAATKTITPLIPSGKLGQKVIKKKPKPTEPGNKYNLRFVPVDPIKHAPSIITASLETAALASQDYSLEFCAREKSLPYAKMIHNRLMLGALDQNIQQVDPKAAFLIAEATIWILRTIIEKLVSRSKFKDKLRSDFLYRKYKDNNSISKKSIKDYEIELDKYSLDDIDFKSIIDRETNGDKSLDEDTMEVDKNLDDENIHEMNEIKSILNDMNKLKAKKLPLNLMDLKILFQVNRCCFFGFEFFF
ncbi:unnamed protein product [Brachionus calyciflorus]|uniref:Transcriptional adapter 1-like protein n=1 Tax=Brachionus calyciflorus TaxID=104777 RepID=A0A814I7J1_9BILA|nr:unnamed protein product [Brachionus calyciflorus]